jgi:hypothetical protein
MADPAYIVDNVLTDGEAWVAIASTTLTGDAATITFTSTDDGQVGDFSQYMDLITISYWRSTRTGGLDIPWYSLNGNTTAGDYVNQMFIGTSSAALAEGRTAGARSMGAYMAAADHTTNIFSSMISTWFDINSGKYKTSLHQNACSFDGSGYVDITVDTWKKQAAITSLMFTPENGDFLTGTRIDLFGVLPRMVA